MGSGCEGYASSTSIGYCNNAAFCQTGPQVDVCDALMVSPITLSSCGNEECMRPGACPAGDLASNWNSVDALCFTSRYETQRIA